jgi:DNA-binding transcriptional LysR family regulator
VRKLCPRHRRSDNLLFLEQVILDYSSMARLDLSELEVFATVGRTLSFRAAARVLGVSPSAISHAVGGLEIRLGVRLFNRTTRSVALTEAGQRLQDRLTPALDEITGALAEVADRPERPAGRLRLCVPRSALILGLTDRLAEFCAAHPEIDLDLANVEGRTDIVSQGFDAGVRIGEMLDADVIAIPIGPPLRLVVVATPALLDRCGRPASPADLRRLPGLIRRFPDGSFYEWEFEKDGRAVAIAPKPHLVADDSATLAHMVRAGLGLAYLFEGYVAADLAAGRLEQVLPDWSPPFPGFHLYHPSRRQMRPALRALIDHLRYKAPPASLPARP